MKTTFEIKCELISRIFSSVFRFEFLDRFDEKMAIDKTKTFRSFIHQYIKKIERKTKYVLTYYLANIDQKGLQFKVKQEFTLELVTTYSSCTIYFHSRNAIH